MFLFGNILLCCQLLTFLFLFISIGTMKTIREQLSIFLSLAGVSANRLSVVSGVPRSIICKVLSGKQPDVRLRTATALYDAMKILDPAAARKVLH